MTRITVLTLLASLMVSSPGRAEAPAATTGAKPDAMPNAIMGSLGGSAVSDGDLARGRARGILINEATGTGTVTNNSVGNRSITGVITNTNAVNNNSGITTVFQNTGNNSLFQSNTSIYINTR